eukprot:948882_1
MSNQYSQSQQNFYQQPNQQQQWMAYQQQQNPSSMNNLMTEHQKQWQQHIAMAEHQKQWQQQQTGSAMNLNQQNNYALWQKQYQSHQNNAYSDMNMTNYQTMQQQQQAYIAMQQRQAIIRQQQIAQSQRALFQQQARNNMYANASTGQIPNTGYNQRTSNANPNFLSQNAIYDRKMGKLEEDEEMDHEHESFVPPAPQSRQEIQKYVHWQAKRKGIDEQTKINAQIETREKMVGLNTEKDKKIEFKNATKKNSYTEPLLSDRGHKDSDIDYECLDQQKEKSGGCCCVVM